MLDQVLQLSYGSRVSSYKMGRVVKMLFYKMQGLEYLLVGHMVHRSVVEISSWIAFLSLKLRGQIGSWVHDIDSANMVTQDTGTVTRCAVRACEALKRSTVLMPACSQYSKPATSAVKCSELGIPQERRNRYALHPHLIHTASTSLALSPIFWVYCCFQYGCSETKSRGSRTVQWHHQQNRFEPWHQRNQNWGAYR